MKFTANFISSYSKESGRESRDLQLCKNGFVIGLLLQKRKQPKSVLCHAVTLGDSVPLSKGKNKNTAVLFNKTNVAQFMRKAILLVDQTVVSYIFPRASESPK